MRLLACLIVAPQRGYDEPAILSYAISSFCPTSADGLQSKAVQHAFLDENSARHNKISNAVLIGIGCGRSMLRRDARLRHGYAPQGDDQRQQHESVSRAPHSLSTPNFMNIPFDVGS